MIPPNCSPMIDVSASQGPNIDWDRVKASGIQRVIVECGIGNDTPNELRAVQVAGAKAAGLIVQLYDFGYALPSDGVHANRDPVEQAQLFFSEAAALGCADRATVLDLEFPKDTDMAKWNESAAGVLEWGLKCLAELERLTGITPWLYASKGYLAALNSDAALDLATFPLWLAAWSDSPPAVPGPWTEWTAWQRSNTGIVDGIDCPVDLSWVLTAA